MAQPSIYQTALLPARQVMAEAQAESVDLNLAVTAAELDAIERLLGEELSALLNS